ncbi:NAD-dependent methanol dehydrogenase [Sinobacterium norvegicum]|uniref:NAD-dependent methanol dehydrogenase n=1 Tax=Sinobacterium norvegicum TaxID=1641715 RepID=A0ABM9ABU1_9GAMM|nr:iron-containing alcohol dehydrogenase [Sinobacterium norvegicum]CAH0990436.1 NAD-dependent methanol dehydrogenase [Sinobacterium norvegicum]
MALPSIDDVEHIVLSTIDQLSTRSIYSFRAPLLTYVGEGASSKLGSTLQDEAVASVLFVADRIVHHLGLLDGAIRSCENVGIRVSVFDRVEGETCDAVVYEGIEALKKSNADYIIGFGGGSALDAAKAIAVLADHPKSLDSIAVVGEKFKPRIGLGAVPTTAGTGSEVTDVAVILDKKNNKKVVIKHPKLIPDLAILDPNLMLAIPAPITAATGVDTLCHAIEAYVAKDSCSLARALAARSIRICFRWLAKCVGDGSSVYPRKKMAEASYMAGLAFSNAGLGLVHAMSHQIGAKYHIPHGVANAIMLPPVMRFNSLVCADAFSALAKLIDLPLQGLTKLQRSDAFITAVTNLILRLGLPADLKSFDVCASTFDGLAKQAIDDICILTNPRTTTCEQIVDLYRQAQVSSVNTGDHHVGI